MLGVVPFSRTSHGLLCSRATAKRFLPPRGVRVAAAGEVQRAAAALRHEVRGRLRIGTILDPEFLRLGGFLRQLVETYPQIETAPQASAARSGWVFERIKALDLDVGFYIVDPAARRSTRRRLSAFTEVTLTPFLYRVLGPSGGLSDNQREQGQTRLGRASLRCRIWTPPESAHHRLLSRIFRAGGRHARDRRGSRSGAVDARSRQMRRRASRLARDSIAIAQAHAHALTIVEGMTVSTQLSFLALAERRDEPAIAAALRALIEDQWSV